MRARVGVLRDSLLVGLLVFACGCDRSGPAKAQPGAAPRPAPADHATLAEDSADDAASVVRAYYRAIHERRYSDAYHLWASSGAASGKSLAEFRDGFASTDSVAVVLGIPGSIEGAAGSRYIEIPVRITAVSTDGARQVFVGTYTLRRSVVDGATSEQRAWRIYSAKLREGRGGSLSERIRIESAHDLSTSIEICRNHRIHGDCRDLSWNHILRQA